MRMLFHVVACFHPTHAAILIGHKAWPSWWPLHILLQLFHNYLVMTMIVINTLSRILVFWCGISLIVVVIIKLESKYALAQIEHFNEGWCTFCPVWIKVRRVSSTLIRLFLYAFVFQFNVTAHIQIRKLNLICMLRLQNVISFQYYLDRVIYTFATRQQLMANFVIW